ncbi:MAG: crossover junction endodeoxyribonuclease RuvC [Actinomycetota bacterium]
MFVLGIDPGLTATGYGLVRSGHPLRAVAAGVIRTSPGLAIGERLAHLHRCLAELLAEHRPDAISVESVFTNRNLNTAISVGRASGVAILAAAQAGLEVTEYAPTAVKSAVTGDGSADKKAVAAMVARLLGLSAPPTPADAADGLAVALCHLRSAPLQAQTRRIMGGRR